MIIALLEIIQSFIQFSNWIRWFWVRKRWSSWLKLSHKLVVVNIGNDVEIGANTTIDRGCLSDTVRVMA